MTKKHEWKSVLKRILVFLVTRILILVILVIVQKIVTWSGAPIIIPSMVAPSTTFSFFRNIQKSAIKPIPNPHEWKSVSFIRQSRSFHYGRVVLIFFLFFKGD